MRHAEPARRRPAAFTTKELLLSAAAIVLFFVIFIFPTSAPAVLLFGWFGYITQTLPRVTVNPKSAASALVWLALFTAGLHALCRWLHREVGVRKRLDTSRPWRLRWTVAGVGLVMLMFAAGTAMTAATHQVAFLAASEEPMYAYRERFADVDGERLKRMVSSNWELARSGGWTAAEIRRGFEADGRDADDFANHLHLIALDGPDGKLSALVVFHRDPARRERNGIVLATPDGVRIEPAEKLSNVLASVSQQPSSRPATSPAD